MFLYKKLNILILILIYLFLLIINNTLQNCHYNCKDGKENLVEAKSDFKTKYPIKIKKLRGTLYRPNKLPSCNENRATVLMPGIVKLLEGEMFVPKNNYDLIKSGTIKMTVNSPNFEKPLCLNGKSQYLAMPNYWCSFNLCEFIGNNLCKLLQIPGFHTIKELEKVLNFNSTLLLPDPPGFFGITLLDLFSGEFSFIMTVETENKIIMELNIPTNQKYLQIGLDNTFTEEC